MINSGVVAAIHVAGVRGDPCGTTRVTTHTCYSIAATTPDLTIEILNSVF